MAMREEHSDDDLVFLKEIPAAEEQTLAEYFRLIKKPKIEEGASGMAANEAASSVRVRSVPWPPLDENLEFYRKPEVVKNAQSAGILHFLSATLAPIQIQDQEVSEFVERYQVATQIGFVREKRLELTAEVVSRALKVPNCGVSWTSLKKEDYSIGQCFSTLTFLDSIGKELHTAVRVSKTQLTREWRPMVEFVQRWLFWDLDPNGVELGTVVAAVALFQHGLTINWAKLLARKLHQSVEQVKINPIDSEKSFCGGYYLTRIFKLADPIVTTVKAELERREDQSVSMPVSQSLQAPQVYRKLVQDTNQLANLSAGGFSTSNNF